MDDGSASKGESINPPLTHPRAARVKAFMRTRRGHLGLILFPLVLVLLAISLGVTFGIRAHRQAKWAQQPAPATVTITLALNAPENASAIDPALVGFSLEGDKWTDWAGIGGPNQFVINALGNLQNKTGATPWVRVGADTEDHTIYNSATNYSTAIFAPPSYLRPYPEASNLTVGDGYYAVVSHLPPNTPVVFGVNLGSNNTANAVSMARSIISAFDSESTKAKNISLAFLELGNEADLYHNNGLRPPNYTAKAWVHEWTALATNISSQFGLANRATRIWGPSFSESTHGAGFSPEGIFQLGLRNSSAGKLLQAVSQHHYSGTFCFGSRAVLQDLILKANIHNNISMFSQDIAATKAAGLPYVLGETNSISCHGAPGVSDAAAAAIWHVDYALYAASSGIDRLFFHEGIGYKYGLIQPVPLMFDIEHGTPLAEPLPPHVQPQYYGALLVADAIGASGTTRITSLDVDSPYVSAYAIYERETIKRVVIINGFAWTSGDAAHGLKRSSTHVSLAGLSSSTLTVRRLAILYADETYPSANITWAGQNYNTTDGLVTGSAVSQTLQLSAGVDVAASEVVLLEF